MSELNFRVIITGILLSIIMGSANVYLGLKAGMTVSASIPAAVMGMILLRQIYTLWPKGNENFVLEANQIQTAASAGESLAAGIIFTMPALIIIGVWNQFDIVLTTLIAFTGGLLGILFMIPMRHVFIVNNEDNLKYPEGLACASVLQAGQVQKGDYKGHLIIKGIIYGGLFKGAISFLGIIKSTLENASLIGNRIFFFGGDISPALLAVGFIVRINVSVLIFIGGSIGWLIGIPLLGDGIEYSSSPVDGAYTLWSTKIRYVGVGAMVVGGLFSIYKVRRGLNEAIRILFRSQNKSSPEIVRSNQRDLSSKTINLFSLIAISLVSAVYYYITQNFAVTIVTTIIMIIMAFFFTAVASYIVGLVGNSNSPVSGMTITAVLFTGGLLYILGFSGTQGMVATLGVAAIVCCAACTSGDVCNDLKTGQIVGASPYKQQIMQIIGVAFASLIMAPILQLLHDNTPGGIGGKELVAPQAGLFASLADGIFGESKLPLDFVMIGATVGILIISLDFYFFSKSNTGFRLHLMPIAVGMYLPFGLSTPILVGGIMSWYTLRYSDPLVEEDTALHNGILASSGLIAGESLMGIFLALIASIGLQRINLLDNHPDIITSLTLISSLGIIYWLYRSSR